MIRQVPTYLSGLAVIAKEWIAESKLRNYTIAIQVKDNIVYRHCFNYELVTILNDILF